MSKSTLWCCGCRKDMEKKQANEKEWLCQCWCHKEDKDIVEVEK